MQLTGAHSGFEAAEEGKKILVALFGVVQFAR